MSALPVRHLVFRFPEVVTQPGVEALMQEAGARFTAWLYCESPEAEAAPEIARLGIERVIPRARWLFADRASAAGITRTAQRIPARGLEILWIDDRPAVTSAVIRAGMNAAVFVDCFRLRRNLVLRGMLE